MHLIWLLTVIIHGVKLRLNSVTFSIHFIKQSSGLCSRFTSSWFLVSKPSLKHDPTFQRSVLLASVLSLLPKNITTLSVLFVKRVDCCWGFFFFVSGYVELSWAVRVISVRKIRQMYWATQANSYRSGGLRENVYHQFKSKSFYSVKKKLCISYYTPLLENFIVY